MGRGFFIAVSVMAVAAGSAAVLAQEDRIETPIVAVESDTSAAALQAERRALLQARRQSEQARIRSEKLEADAQNAADEADRAGRRAAALAARIQQSEAELEAAEARVAIVSQLQREQAVRLALRQQPVVRLTGALQSLARRPTLAALAQPGSVTDVVHVRAVLDSVVPEIQRRTAGLRAEIARSRQLRAQADLASRSLRDSRTRLAQRQQELRAMESKQRQSAQAFADDAGVEGQRAIALGEKARDIVDLMDRLEVAGDIKARLIALPGPMMRPAQPGGTATSEAQVRASATAAYRLPVIGELISGLGEVSESGVRAKGLTIRTRAKALVVAPTAGRILFAGPYRGYGQIVIIDHGGGWNTLLTGMASLNVRVGQALGQGDPIGATGEGRPKVTVELRRNGRPIDIAPLLAS